MPWWFWMLAVVVLLLPAAAAVTTAFWYTAGTPGAWAFLRFALIALALGALGGLLVSALVIGLALLVREARS
jgi:hypothetical protein